jgi:uncharacterized protein (TIGR02453 family)
VTTGLSSRAFTPGLFAFMRELREHNDRAWFQDNKDRYEREVKEPALDFVSDFWPLLHEISPYFVADPRPVGGSMFRIHRDVRFSKDKSPYKTHVGLHFRHELGREAYAPGFYLHLEPRATFSGAGIWHPDSATLKRVRDAIVADPDRWRRVIADPAFAARHRIAGRTLVRPPAGYDRDHPLIEDLKRKDFAATSRLTERAVTSRGFLEAYAERCREAMPFMAFLCDALGLPC